MPRDLLAALRQLATDARLPHAGHLFASRQSLRPGEAPDPATPARTAHLSRFAAWRIVQACADRAGVLVTDTLQFAITMSGAFAVAYFAVTQPQIGGLRGLFAKVPPASLHMLPDLGNWSAALTVFIIPITIQWWSVWYPGSEPGGGSYVAQRMLASKTEKIGRAHV